MENYENITQVINFWVGIVFCVIMFIAFILSLIDRETDLHGYMGMVAIWIIGALVCFKAATFIILLFIIFILPFIIIWQIRRFIFKLLNRHGNS